MDIFLSIIAVYIFILLGFLAKKMLKEDIQEKSLVVLTIYFLQPMLTFWGLSTKKIDTAMLQSPLYFVMIIFICTVCSFLIASTFFKDKKERSIITVSSVISNTGNLGIPLGIALFGEASIIYTTLINVANIFISYTIGVYFYSRGSFSFRDSIKNIVKLPLIWFALLALIFNFNDITMHKSILYSLQMGAYAGMVLQLIIFGMYLYSIKLKELNKKLLLHVSFIKFILIPIISFIVLSSLELDRYMMQIILLELLVPLAVTNINLSSLYNCKPIDVTSLVFFTSLFFIPYIVLISLLLEHIK